MISGTATKGAAMSGARYVERTIRPTNREGIETEAEVLTSV